MTNELHTFYIDETVGEGIFVCEAKSEDEAWQILSNTLGEEQVDNWIYGGTSKPPYYSYYYFDTV